MSEIHQTLAYKIAGYFQELPQVTAIALAGSQTNQRSDAASDIDVYVYHTDEVLLADRTRIAQASGATQANLGMDFFGQGDEWIDGVTQIGVDIVYFETTWMVAQIERVLTHHQANMGYSTAFWHTIRHYQILHDPSGWFRALYEKCQQPYPEALRRAIIAKNYPILRGVIPAYLHQIEKAMKRNDAVSVNHRVAALLASYFDVLFALNYLPHPGEKRLLSLAQKDCPKCPPNIESHIMGLLKATATMNGELPRLVNQLIDELEVLLVAERLL